jgi:predicted PurR-regulated permease PerM
MSKGVAVELRLFFYKSLIVVGILVGLYVLYQVRAILLLLFGAILFASTIRPLVVYLKNRRIAPIVSVLIIYLGVLGTLIGSALILFPTILLDVRDLANSQNTLFWSLGVALDRIQLLASDGTGLHLPIPSAAELLAELTQLQISTQAHLSAYLLDGFQFASGAVILFVLAFYWLTERDRFEDVALQMVPLRQRVRFVSVFNEIEGALGAFVRGETILCVTVGLLAFSALSLLDVRSPLLLAVFAAMAEAVPMIGPILGAAPALLIALMQSPEKAVMVAIAYLVIQQLEAQLLVPKIMERNVGLSPLFVLLALTSGNLLAGIPGAIVAIPIAAVLKILVREMVIEPTVAANQLPTVGGAVLLTEAVHDATPAPLPASNGQDIEPVPQTGRTR